MTSFPTYGATTVLESRVPSKKKEQQTDSQVSGNTDSHWPLRWFYYLVEQGLLVLSLHKASIPCVPFAIVPQLKVGKECIHILWMDEILHQLETMGNCCLLAFTRELSFQGFLGGAGFRPSTVPFEPVERTSIKRCHNRFRSHRIPGA